MASRRWCSPHFTTYRKLKLKIEKTPQKRSFGSWSTKAERSRSSSDQLASGSSWQSICWERRDGFQINCTVLETWEVAVEKWSLAPVVPVSVRLVSNCYSIHQGRIKNSNVCLRKHSFLVCVSSKWSLNWRRHQQNLGQMCLVKVCSQCGKWFQVNSKLPSFPVHCFIDLLSTCHFSVSFPLEVHTYWQC